MDVTVEVIRLLNCPLCGVVYIKLMGLSGVLSSGAGKPAVFDPLSCQRCVKKSVAEQNSSGRDGTDDNEKDKVDGRPDEGQNKQKTAG